MLFALVTLDLDDLMIYGFLYACNKPAYIFKST